MAISFSNVRRFIDRFFRRRATLHRSTFAAFTLTTRPYLQNGCERGCLKMQCKFTRSWRWKQADPLRGCDSRTPVGMQPSGVRLIDTRFDIWLSTTPLCSFQILLKKSCRWNVAGACVQKNVFSWNATLSTKSVPTKPASMRSCPRNAFWTKRYGLHLWSQLLRDFVSANVAWMTSQCDVMLWRHLERSFKSSLFIAPI